MMAWATSAKWRACCGRHPLRAAHACTSDGTESSPASRRSLNACAAAFVSEGGERPVLRFIVFVTESRAASTTGLPTSAARLAASPVLMSVGFQCLPRVDVGAVPGHDAERWRAEPVDPPLELLVARPEPDNGTVR